MLLGLLEESYQLSVFYVRIESVIPDYSKEGGQELSTEQE